MIWPLATRDPFGRRPLLLLLLSLLMTGWSSPALGAGEPTARLLTGGAARPGAELAVQIEVAWDGRPEAYAPGLPALELPRGAGLRLGRTGSRFDGTRSTWWTNAVVTLPSTPPPYLLGPGTVPVMTAGGETTLTAPARSVGARSQRSTLWGQGIGSAFVLAVALAGLTLLWRRLPQDPAPMERARLVAAVRQTLDSGGVTAAMQEALPLLEALRRDPASVDFVPDTAGWMARRDSLQYGGGADEVTRAHADLRRLLAIASALE